MFLSVVVALALTPALCGSILEPTAPHKKSFFGAFNRFLQQDQARLSEQRSLRACNRSGGMLVIYALLCGAMGFALASCRAASPTEDQGEIVGAVHPARQRVLKFYVPPKSAARCAVSFLTKASQYQRDLHHLKASASAAAAERQDGVCLPENWSERKGDANTARAIALRARRTEHHPRCDHLLP